MINDYIIRWNIEKFLEEDQYLKFHFYKRTFDCLINYFSFKVENAQSSDNCVSFNNFIGKTDFIFNPKDSSFNLFYTYSIKDLDLNAVYMNKINKIRLEEGYLYCVPYWMAFMLESEDKTFNQKTINATVFTSDRPFLKSKKIYW